MSFNGVDDVEMQDALPAPSPLSPATHRSSSPSLPPPTSSSSPASATISHFLAFLAKYNRAIGGSIHKFNHSDFSADDEEKYLERLRAGFRRIVADFLHPTANPRSGKIAFKPPQNSAQTASTRMQPIRRQFPPKFRPSQNRSPNF